MLFYNRSEMSRYRHGSCFFNTSEVRNMQKWLSYCGASYCYFVIWGMIGTFAQFGLVESMAMSPWPVFMSVAIAITMLLAALLPIFMLMQHEKSAISLVFLVLSSAIMPLGAFGTLGIAADLLHAGSTGDQQLWALPLLACSIGLLVASKRCSAQVFRICS